MAIPYRTAKFKSAKIFAIVILGSTAKFNFRQYFRLYGIPMSRIYSSLSSFLSGPPIQIIPDYRAREEGDTDIDKQQLQLEDEEGEGEEEDRAFATVLEDAGIRDSISMYPSTTCMYVHV